MSAISKRRFLTAVSLPAVIFATCIVITFSSVYMQHKSILSIALTGDLLITAPLLYYLAIRKTSIPKISILRIIMAGSIITALLFSQANLYIVHIIKSRISPLIELSLLAYIAWSFYVAGKRIDEKAMERNDFLLHCRAVLFTLLRNKKISDIIASEIAVFYYCIFKRGSRISNTSVYTSYKANGIILVLYTFLGLFIIETAGMHFLLRIWNNTAAWIFTSLSAYSCVQLLSHIRSLKNRPSFISGERIFLCNGLLGGDAVISIDNIESIQLTNKQVIAEKVIRIALLKGMERHNIAIFLKTPVTVIKAFGISKQAKVLLINIDNPQQFIQDARQRD